MSKTSTRIEAEITFKKAAAFYRSVSEGYDIMHARDEAKALDMLAIEAALVDYKRALKDFAGVVGSQAAYEMSEACGIDAGTVSAALDPNPEE